jgi:hypothetical protein
MRKIVLTLALFGFAVCSSARDYGPDSPYYHFPTGWQIALNRPIEIPPGRTTAWLQYGRVVPYGPVPEDEPQCVFELDTVRATAQRVEPDSFTVTKVTRNMTEFGGLTASPGFVRVDMTLGRGGNGSPSWMYYQTVFHLRSENRPQVRSLTCQSNQYAAGVIITRHLTVPEIRQALGQWFSLKLPAN